MSITPEELASLILTSLEKAKAAADDRVKNAKNSTLAAFAELSHSTYDLMIIHVKKICTANGVNLEEKQAEDSTEPHI